MLGSGTVSVRGNIVSAHALSKMIVSFIEYPLLFALGYSWSTMEVYVRVFTRKEDMSMSRICMCILVTYDAFLMLI